MCGVYVRLQRVVECDAAVDRARLARQFHRRVQPHHVAAPVSTGAGRAQRTRVPALARRVPLQVTGPLFQFPRAPHTTPRRLVGWLE